jgi:dihydropteroate synthase
MSTTRPILRCGERTFQLGQRTFVMGIVNVTPDSFSDGGRFHDVDDAVTQALRLFDAGADVVDIGGESTRPGATPVDPRDEQARILPVVAALVARGRTAVSVDTRHASTARVALDAGAAWINDVSGLADADMAAVASKAQALVLMHWQHPLDADHADDAVDDGDIAATVEAWLGERVRRAVAGGVPRERILVDPGIGFGKTLAHNLALSRDLDRLGERCGVAGVVYGPSRKRFLGALVGKANAADRDDATLGAVCAAIAGGVDVVRVHDVGRVKDAVIVADAIRRAATARPR